MFASNFSTSGLNINKNNNKIIRRYLVGSGVAFDNELYVNCIGQFFIKIFEIHMYVLFSCNSVNNLQYKFEISYKAN